MTSYEGIERPDIRAGRAISADDSHCLAKAIAWSEISVRRGRFPAGAVVAYGSRLVSRNVSDAYPGYQHAEIKAVHSAFQQSVRLNNQGLKGFTLYASMEPCLMCLSTAYWAGIRRIVFAIARESVDASYYESGCSSAGIVGDFGDPLQLIQLESLEKRALRVVRGWLRSR